MILPPSQHSCTIRACKILELKNTFFRMTVKNCESFKCISISAADLFFLVTFWLPHFSNGCPFHAGRRDSTEVTANTDSAGKRPFSTALPNLNSWCVQREWITRNFCTLTYQTCSEIIKTITINKGLTKIRNTPYRIC